MSSPYKLPLRYSIDRKGYIIVDSDGIAVHPDELTDLLNRPSLLADEVASLKAKLVEALKEPTAQELQAAWDSDSPSGYTTLIAARRVRLTPQRGPSGQSTARRY